MKKLLFMRHAKSSWSEPLQKDFDRTLNDRGKSDAPIMAERIGKQFIPELIIASPAKRTQKTAKIFIETLKLNDNILEFNMGLYEAEISDILHVIRETDDRVNQLMLVGHNPGFTGIVGFLTENFIENMPTSGAALLQLNILSWKQVSRNCGTIEWFNFPNKSDV